ncbi:hypothetical protein B2K_40055 [Paenibacillus mucilaginosus K02]|uniref:Uncharacterized protein n=1 Tax=Paenibacillus mucilaginosus K02 TaxID=997761 RepID=R9ULV6_9BACL|nr:hypothetical protein B2K_40055 [Paenibacillus mucilaginosus K02]
MTGRREGSLSHYFSQPLSFWKPLTTLRFIGFAYIRYLWRRGS